MKSAALTFDATLTRIDLSGLLPLFWLTLRQHSHGRRLVVMAALFSLPAALAGIVRYFNPSLPRDHLEMALILQVLPHTLVPLCALLYASGMIQDEIEEQTLTYLLIRPLPRWAIYVAKWLATVLVVSLLAGVFTLVCYAAIYLGVVNSWDERIATRALKTAATFALAVLAYCSFFGWLSLLVKRSLIVGAAYIILFEGVLANIPFLSRSLTIMYYFRVLTEHWTGRTIREWQIDLSDAPSAGTCVIVLAGVAVVTTALAALWFTIREFRVKTPEGN